MPAPRYNTVIHWFRRDLRVHDNTALAEACAQARHVIPLFVLDDAILGRPDTGSARVVFLLDALKVLDANLREHHGARLILRHGKNPDTLLALMREYDADAVFFNRDYEPLARERDTAVIDGARAMGKAAETFKDQVLFEPDELCSKSGEHYTVYAPFKRLWFATPADAPRKTPGHIPLPDGDLRGEEVPGPEKLKFRTSQEFECGGESAALELLKAFTHDRIATYDDRRNDMGADLTSRLSRHFHLGTLGIRTAVQAARGKPGADHWLSELAWRDFYTSVLWFYPHVERGPMRRQFEHVRWHRSERNLQAWQDGMTGYPLVDAGMRQLNAEAWMHNRARMVTASFLCKDLLINWQEGERYFMKQLVDGDLAQNNGGWQWVAGTGTDPQPYFRIFNPVTQSKNFDPKGVYIRRWIPELADVPDKFIHEPWKLSYGEQRAANCIIGKDYPKPMVDHARQRDAALAMYREVTTPEQQAGHEVDGGQEYGA